MIYLDNGATSFPKPPQVERAMLDALRCCANPGRGGYSAALRATKMVYRCRETAARLFDCQPEQVVFTGNCTHGLNIAIRTLVKPGSRVLISGFEHNAVTRPLRAVGAAVTVAGKRLFDWQEMLENWEKALRSGMDAAVFTHVSNVFGYILPVQQMAGLCKRYGVPFVLDAAQSAGVLDVHLQQLGAAFIAMPGHKGLLGPMGTGLLLCNEKPVPLIAGGTGTESASQNMPDDLPERAEAGTHNVPGIAGLCAGMEYVRKAGLETVFCREQQAVKQCIRDLQRLGYRVFAGEHQAGTVSFVPDEDCEVFAERLGQADIAVRAGLHCAPLAHQSAGTLKTGTVRISFGHNASPWQNEALRQALEKVSAKRITNV